MSKMMARSLGDGMAYLTGRLNNIVSEGLLAAFLERSKPMMGGSTERMITTAIT